MPDLVLTEINVNYNGNSDSELYSDKEDGKNPLIIFPIYILTTDNVDIQVNNWNFKTKFFFFYIHTVLHHRQYAKFPLV